MPTNYNNFNFSCNDSFNLIKNNILPLYNIHSCNIEQIKVKNTNKDRAVFKITCNNKSFCLKKVYYDEGKLLFIYSALEWLYRNNINVPTLIPSISKNRFVKYKNFLFILTPWIYGKKCDFDNLDNIYIASKNLALLHKCSNNFFPINDSYTKENYEDIYTSFKSRTEKLLYYYNEAMKRHDYFSEIFISSLVRTFI